MTTDTATVDDAATGTYVSAVHLLCATCQQPIRATITTAQWIRVEWISPDGECQACSRERKEEE